MKSLRTLFVAVIAGAAAVSSCNKADSVIATPAGATESAVKPGIPNTGTYMQYAISTILTKPGDLVAWHAGGINAVTMRFQATQDIGNPLKLITASQPVSVTRQTLFAPIALGSVNVQNGKYFAFKFAVDLNPQVGIYALRLDGNYSAFIDPNRVPAKITATAARAIHLFVTDPVQFTGEYTPSLLITNPNYYTLTFYFDPAALMSGITSGMLDQAQTSNDNIYITADQNVNLYKQILLNLKSNLLIRLEVKGALPSA